MWLVGLSVSSQVYINSFIPPSLNLIFLHHTHINNLRSRQLTTFQIKPNQTKPTITMDSIKQGANFVSEKVQQATSGTEKEANKQVAKDSDASIGTR